MSEHQDSAFAACPHGKEHWGMCDFCNEAGKACTPTVVRHGEAPTMTLTLDEVARIREHFMGDVCGRNRAAVDDVFRKVDAFWCIETARRDEPDALAEVEAEHSHSNQPPVIRALAILREMTVDGVLKPNCHAILAGHLDPQACPKCGGPTHQACVKQCKKVIADRMAKASYAELADAASDILKRWCPHAGSCCTFDAARKIVVTPESCRCPDDAKRLRAALGELPLPCSEPTPSERSDK